MGWPPNHYFRGFIPIVIPVLQPWYTIRVERRVISYRGAPSCLGPVWFDPTPPGILTINRGLGALERDFSQRGRLLGAQVLEWVTFCLKITIHPGRLTWNIIMEVGKIIFLSKWVI